MNNVDPGSTRLGFIHKNTISYHLERLSYDWYWASVLSLYVSNCHLYETSPSHIQPPYLWQHPKKGSRARRKLRMGSFSQVFAKEHCEVGAKAWFGLFPGCNRRNAHSNILLYSPWFIKVILITYVFLSSIFFSFAPIYWLFCSLLPAIPTNSSFSLLFLPISSLLLMRLAITLMPLR